MQDQSYHFVSQGLSLYKVEWFLVVHLLWTSWLRTQEQETTKLTQRAMLKPSSGAYFLLNFIKRHYTALGFFSVIITTTCSLWLRGGFLPTLGLPNTALAWLLGRFTQNLSAFRREVNDSMKNSTYGVNSNDMMSWRLVRRLSLAWAREVNFSDGKTKGHFWSLLVPGARLQEEGV